MRFTPTAAHGSGGTAQETDTPLDKHILINTIDGQLVISDHSGCDRRTDSIAILIKNGILNLIGVNFDQTVLSGGLMVP